MRAEIYPRPQWLRQLDDALLIEPPVRIGVSSAEHQSAAKRLAADITLRWGCQSTVVDAGDNPAILVGTLDDPGMAEELEARGVVADEVRRGEGYVIHAGGDRAIVTGYDPAGLFYGVQSLLQLVNRDGARLRITGAEVHDWPAKPVRGIHIYMPGRNQIPFFKRLLTWLASVKYNTVFLEVSGGMRYERHPEINEAWERFCTEANAFPGGARAMQSSRSFIKDSTHTELAGGSYLEKSEVTDLLRFASNLHIEVIPEVQTLSHAYYLCTAHPEIAERPEDPYPDTYCPSNPRTYEILFDVLDEVIEVFQPRVLHIGHDEIYTLGVCPRCREKSGNDLLASDVNRVHRFLAERGVRTAMWGDKLLAIWQRGVPAAGMEQNVDDPSRGKKYYIPETYRAIEKIPRDVLIVDWYWKLDPRSSEFFLKEGFEVVLGNFGGNFAAQEFDRWNERASSTGILGVEVSTWCEVSEFALGYNGCLFNLLFAAQIAWWSHYRDLDRAATIAAIATRMPAARDVLRGSRTPSSENASKRTPLTLKVARPGVHQFDKVGELPSGTPFSIDPQGLAVRVDAAHPAVQVPVGRAFKGLLLLQACYSEILRRPTWNLPDQLHHPNENLMALYRVRYSTGEEAEIPIHYGSHIARRDVPYGEHIDAVPWWADPIQVGDDETGRRITLYRYEWVNPVPDKVVRRIDVEYAGDKLGVYWLIAATTLDR